MGRMRVDGRPLRHPNLSPQGYISRLTDGSFSACVRAACRVAAPHTPAPGACGGARLPRRRRHAVHAHAAGSSGATLADCRSGSGAPIDAGAVRRPSAAAQRELIHWPVSRPAAARAGRPASRPPASREIPPDGQSTGSSGASRSSPSRSARRSPRDCRRTCTAGNPRRRSPRN
jgi:hypothetical protein